MVYIADLGIGQHLHQQVRLAVCGWLSVADCPRLKVTEHGSGSTISTVVTADQ
jgi:hypothetical protein